MKRLSWALAVGALLLTALPADARRKKEEPVARSGTLIDNVNGLSVDGAGRLVRFSALMIGADGKVQARLAPDETRPANAQYRLDGQGRTMIPAFVLSRVNMRDLGISRMTLDLSGAGSLAEAQRSIAAHVAQYPDRRWIFGGGWSLARWNMATPPTPADLDAVTRGIPAWITSEDGSIGWANGAALKLAGVSPDAAMTPAGQAKLRAAVPPPSPKDRDVAFDQAQSALIAAGYGAVSAVGLDISDWQSLRRAGDRGALRLRVAGYAQDVAQMALIAGPGPTPWLYEGRLRLNGISLNADMPSADAPASSRLRNQMSRAAMDGFQVSLFAPTAAQVDDSLDAIAELRETYDGDRDWRIDGIAGDVANLSARAGTMGVRLSFTAPGVPSGWPDGASLDGGPDPFARLATYVRAAGDPYAALSAGLRAMTRNPATAAQAGDRYGALEPGQWADFLLIDRNIATAGADGIAATRILESWIGGRKVLSEGK